MANVKWNSLRKGKVRYMVGLVSVLLERKNALLSKWWFRIDMKSLWKNIICQKYGWEESFLNLNLVVVG